MRGQENSRSVRSVRPSIVNTAPSTPSSVRILPYAGKPGKAGPAGPPGKTGATGKTGPDGKIGSGGKTGPIGKAGPTGITGPIGKIGPTGKTGSSGTTGSVGITGPTGIDGKTGSTGPVFVVNSLTEVLLQDTKITSNFFTVDPAETGLPLLDISSNIDINGTVVLTKANASFNASKNFTLGRPVELTTSDLNGGVVFYNKLTTDPSAAFIVHGDASINGIIILNKGAAIDSNINMKSGKTITVSGDVLNFSDLSVNFLAANMIDANYISANDVIVDGPGLLNTCDILYSNQLFVNGNSTFNNGKVFFNDNSVNFVKHTIISQIKDIKDVSNGSRFKSDVDFNDDVFISNNGDLNSKNLIVDVSLTVYGRTSLNGNVYINNYYNSLLVEPSFNNVSLTKGSDIYITNAGVKNSVLSKILSIDARLKALEIK